MIANESVVLLSLIPITTCPSASPSIKLPAAVPPTSPATSVSEAVKSLIDVPLIVKTSPSKVRLLSPFKVLSPLAVSILLLASLLIVIVPAVNAAREDDTEVNPFKVKSTNVGYLLFVVLNHYFLRLLH